jgi:hypothetical protein
VAAGLTQNQAFSILINSETTALIRQIIRCQSLALFSEILALGLILCVVTPPEVEAQRVSFPGVKSETKSPDGRYTIRNTDDPKQEPAHTLTVVDGTTGLKTRFYSYGRHVEVLWSPTSTALLVNDYEGSDTAQPVLFVSPWTNAPINLREKLIDFLRSRGDLRIIEENDHVYFTARRWLNGSELLCEIRGYGGANAKGFSKRYIYALGQGFRIR